jgi:hypothetical protein
LDHATIRGFLRFSAGMIAEHGLARKR